MGMMQFAASGNYKRFYNNLKEISKKNKKNPTLMFIDAAFATIITGSGLSDYLNYKFYNKSWKQRKEYATIGYQAKFYKKGAHDVNRIYSNKLEFLKTFNEYIKRDYYDPRNGIDELKKFIKKHEVFVIKPVNGLGGTDVKKAKITDFENIDALYKKLIDNDMFLEELIIQDKDWGKISPNSINTLRVMTSNVNGDVKIFYIVARIGNGINLADNFHQGGVGVSVDCDKGILVGNAINKDLEEFTVHPISNVKFDGFKVPYFEEIQKICKDAASKFSDVHIVGWDVAISSKGPIIVEGNSGPGFDLVQVVLEKGTKYMLEDVKKELKKQNMW